MPLFPWYYAGMFYPGSRYWERMTENDRGKCAILLRSQFDGAAKWRNPTIPKFKAREDDFTELRLIGFDKTNLENVNHLNRI